MNVNFCNDLLIMKTARSSDDYDFSISTIMCPFRSAMILVRAIKNLKILVLRMSKIFPIIKSLNSRSFTRPYPYDNNFKTGYKICYLKSLYPAKEKICVYDHVWIFITFSIIFVC